LALRDEYVAAGKIRHEQLFFLEDGRPISDPEITRWRWSESIKALSIRPRDQKCDGKKTLCACCIPGFSYRNFALNSAKNHVTQIVIRPPISPEFGSRKSPT